MRHRTQKDLLQSAFLIQILTKDQKIKIKGVKGKRVKGRGSLLIKI